MVQTCVVACYTLASAGGFGCYLLSMDSQTFNNLGPIAGNRAQVLRPAPCAAAQSLTNTFALSMQHGKSFARPYSMHTLSCPVYA